MLNKKLRSLVNKIHDQQLRRRVIELLENPSFQVNDETYTGLPLDVAPAGLSHHHCYPGGFIEHLTSSANIAMALCDSVEKVYHGKVNRDFVVAGMLLHDLFKPLTYSVNENGSYSSTYLADYMDHLSIAVAELVKRGFPLELIHIVSAHHGMYGPIRPRTVEALICHLADLADSRLNGEVLSAAGYLARKAVGRELAGMTSKQAFEIVRSKYLEGWAGVTKTIEKIMRKTKTPKT